MISLSDAVELYAELSLTLAGVVAAFAGRERAFRPIERMRLVGMLVLSASVLGGCLATRAVVLTAAASRALVILPPNYVSELESGAHQSYRAAV